MTKSNNRVNSALALAALWVDAYKKHVAQCDKEGEEPLSFRQFIRIKSNVDKE